MEELNLGLGKYVTVVFKSQDYTPLLNFTVYTFFKSTNRENKNM